MTLKVTNYLCSQEVSHFEASPDIQKNIHIQKTVGIWNSLQTNIPYLAAGYWLDRQFVNSSFPACFDRNLFLFFLPNYVSLNIPGYIN